MHDLLVGLGVAAAGLTAIWLLCCAFDEEANRRWDSMRHEVRR